MFREEITSIWCEQRRVNGGYGTWAIKDNQDFDRVEARGYLRYGPKDWEFQLQKAEQVWFLQQKNEGQTEKADWNQKEIIYFGMLESIIVDIAAI